MHSEKEIQQLKSENEFLQIQLQDLTGIIKVRDEELDILRKAAAYAVNLQSRLDINLDDFEQMQHRINTKERWAEGALKREAILEEEMLQSIKMETEFYNLKDKFTSTSTALTDINKEMDQTTLLYTKIAELNSKIAKLESELEIVRLDGGFMKEKLEKYRKEEEARI